MNEWISAIDIMDEMSKTIVSKVEFNWKLQPILPDEFKQLPILEESFIGVLKNKQSISEVIISLANVLPMPQYLKRCSGLQIYLTSVNKAKGNQENLKKFLIQKGFDISLLEDDFKVVNVPSSAPKTKTQMAYASKYWPINFHPNLYLESLISGSLFDNTQLASLEAYMQLAITIAEKGAVGSRDCNGSALIVDPENGSILSMAVSSLDKHPMWHASMLAVDLVATLQGGGTWKLVNQVENDVKITRLKHCNETPLYYPENINVFKNENWMLITKNKKISKNIKRNLDDKCGPYLCTGYWAILLQEPCPLCAMALLHSRVSRIFYGAFNSQTGILGSKAILHSVPGLNHRYQVWSSILMDKCNRTLEKCHYVDS